MKFLLCTWGSLGDLHPFLSLGAELRGRGHGVTLVVPEVWMNRVRAAGFVGCSTGGPKLVEDYRTSAELFSNKRFGLDALRTMMRDLVAPTLEPTLEVLLALGRDYDCLVSHHFVLPASMAAEKSGGLHATVGLAPGVHPSSFSSPAGSFLKPFQGGVGRRLNRWIWKIGEWMTAGEVDPLVNAVRRHHGLEPVRNALFTSFSKECHLLLYSRHFAEPEPDFPSSMKQAGFCFWDEGGEWTPPESLADFLNGGEPPIVFTLGSSVVHHAGPFYEDAVQAVTDLGRRAVMLIGKDSNRPREAPSNIHFLDYAPHRWIMSKGAVVVHQGGVGTLAQAMRAGVPSVVCPFSFDQPNNGVRLASQGGAVLVRPRERNAAGLTRALRLVLDEPSFALRARQLGDAISAEVGPTRAAEILEHFVVSSRA